MYTVVLGLHNITRWIVLIIGIAAIVRAALGWLGKKEWTALDNKLGLYFTMSMDIQILLGLLLYVVFSPITTAAFSDFGAAMANPDTRFWLVEHIFTMIVALAFAHVGRSLSKKAATDRAKFQRAAIFFTLAMVAVLAAIPWFRPMLPF
ncbi:MAG: hypothetical protein IPF56_04990 [Chloroflexi bacterium]|nr:hypothetical protein [Chloroflexota bacterium]MBK7916186.1 hypothetical protein [Chloroflexota bacterium]MBK8930828.1 hypothetical protein [Chloroflexota bacterium]